ncbi:MAG TPA: hypothetical protein VIM31_00350 [Candidatus Microsaccharimonas sp.]|jgi:serine/threonine protein kinase
MILQRGSRHYQIGDRVAEAETYRTYICVDEETGRRLLLQIAKESMHNGGLDRAVYILRELKKTAESFEVEYAKKGTGTLLSYERLFPNVVDSFIWEDQGNRRAVILEFSEVDDAMKMVPLTNLAKRDHIRVDLRTSAWIMGRLLKLLEFSHNERITVRTFSGNNVLIVPAQHFVVVFDWSSAQTFPDKIPATNRADDIADAAKAVFAAIGGDSETGSYAYLNEGDGETRYVEFLWNLASCRESNAERAHRQFYELVDELYGRKFHPFTTLPL